MNSPLRTNFLPRNAIVVCAAVWAVALAVPTTVRAAKAPAVAAVAAPVGPERPRRELYVPYADLHILLENQPRRVMLPRKQFDELLRQAEQATKSLAPHGVLPLAAEYDGKIQDQRASIRAQLTIDALHEGLQVVPLDLGGVGVVSATIDGKPAALGRLPDGRIAAVVEGPKRRVLELALVAAFETTAAHQLLQLRLPRPPAARMQLVVPGDVELKSGAAVLSRQVQADPRQTRFELIPASADCTLVFTLNSHLKQTESVLTASGVYLHEVTQGYERIHSTVSFQVLYRAVDQLRLVVPAGFEVQEASTPLLTRWEVVKEQGRSVLVVRLREQTTEPIVLNVTAVRAPAVLDEWTASRWEPLDVAAHVAVVGLLLEDRIDAVRLETAGLTPIDVESLRVALPASLLRPAPGVPLLRPVAAWYAAPAVYRLAGRFEKPAGKIASRTNVLLVLDESRQEAIGGFTVVPRHERLFSVDFSSPAGWTVESVTGPDEQPLAFERFVAADGAGRIHVRLPAGVAPDTAYTLHFRATSVPTGWLQPWDQRLVAFPRFAIVEPRAAERAAAIDDVGAIAVEPRGDLVVRPEKLEKLLPLDQAERVQYGLGEVGEGPAYRYDNAVYQAEFAVTRAQPRAVARSLAFYHVKPRVLTVHGELIYTVEEARTRRLRFALPKDTPTLLSVNGLDGVEIEEFSSREGEKTREWTVLLKQPRRGVVRLAIDFDRPIAEDAASLVLPGLSALDVVYQSGLAAVEADPSLRVAVKTDARTVDVGELSEAEYQPGRRLLGAYGFSGNAPTFQLALARDPALPIPEALVGKALLITQLSAQGESQNEAVFSLHAKVLSVEIELPEQADFWAAMVDDEPIKPQRLGSRVLLDLPGARRPTRELRVVYAVPVAPVAIRGTVDLLAPKLFCGLTRTANTLSDKAVAVEQVRAREVPLNQLVWQVRLPAEYRLSGYRGTLTTLDIERPRPAAIGVAEAIWLLGGGVGSGLLAPASQAARESARVASRRGVWGKHVPMADRETAGSAGYPSSGEILGPDGQVAAGLRADAPAAEPTAPMAPPAGKPSDDMLVAKREIAETAKELHVATEPTAAPTLRPTRQPDDFNQSKAHENSRREGGRSMAETPAESKPKASKSGIEGESLERRRKDSLQGIRSLRIQLAQAGGEQSQIEFRSLGGNPQLDLVLSNTERFSFLGWGLFGAAVLWGLCRVQRPARSKTMFVFMLAVITTVVAVLARDVAIVELANHVFHASWTLALLYIAIAVVRWIVSRLLAVGQWLVARRGGKISPDAAATAASTVSAVMIAVVVAWASPLQAADDHTPPPPVAVPDDVIIVPYEPKDDALPAVGDKVLVPYAEYERLRNQVSANQRTAEKKPPLPYAFAGGEYRASLDTDEHVTFQGRFSIELYTDQLTEVPLSLSGGVLAVAQVDGKPARIRIVEPMLRKAASPTANQTQQPLPQQAGDVRPAPAAPIVVLYLSGKGKHELLTEIRLKTAKQGGWRSIEGVVPSAPATSLSLSVPKSGTELRLGHVNDRRNYEVDRDNYTVVTAVNADGAVKIAWRPKVAEAQVDRSLTVESTSVLDVEQEGVRLTCRVSLQFRRGRRDRFELLVPNDYLIESVRGPNVRGWRLNAPPEAAADDAKNPKAAVRSIEIELLKPAEDAEELFVVLWKAAAEPNGPTREWSAPYVVVPDAALHGGTANIRRSPWLDLRTTAKSGVTRTDADPKTAELAGDTVRQRPWPLRPYEAYRFVGVPFDLRLTAAPVTAEFSATVQSLVKIAAFQRTLETRIEITPKGRPLYVAEVLLPEGFVLDQLHAPGLSHWSIATDGPRPRLSVFYAQGSDVPQAMVVQGTLARETPPPELPLPQIEVLAVARQQGEIVIQADPAYGIDAVDLQQAEVRPLARAGWLKPQQMAMARLNISYQSPAYRGKLRLTARTPLVTCETISNVRVTGRAIEETILLEYRIQQAGIRLVKFRLPPQAAGCRVRAPMIRQKKITGEPGKPIDVEIEFQEEMMGRLLVIVENDRLLEPSAVHSVPVPRVANAQVLRQYITLEASGRDEVEEVGPLEGVERLSRNLAEYRLLAARLPGRLDQAYLIRSDVPDAQLRFRTKKREAVQTAGARILLAETLLFVDSAGTYRARQSYRIDNQTEPYLDVELPEGASLWTATVAGEPVKPSRAPAASSRLVRVPLVKTAAGDLDYQVVFTYGGQMAALGGIAPINFPLMRAAGLKPESSVVRLCVPNHFRWVRFGGTMRQIVDEKQLAGEYENYYSKQLEKLKQSLTSGDSYTRVRAANSLQLWQMQVAAGRQAGGPGPHAAIQDQLRGYFDGTSQTIVVDDADAMARNDNRLQLNNSFAEQRNERAKNVVQGVGGNWNVVAQPPQRPASSAKTQFNAGWFTTNKLSPDGLPPETPPEENRDSIEARADAKMPAQPSGQVLWSGKGEGRGKGETRLDELKNPEVAQGRAKKRLSEIQQEQQMDLGLVQQPQSRVSDEQNLQRYNERLQKDQSRQIAQQMPDLGINAAPSNQPLGPAGPAAMGGVGGGFEADADRAEVLRKGQGQGDETSITATDEMLGDAFGLASLDLAMPEIDPNRYEVFRFTTPLGQTELTGWAVSREWTRTASHLGLTAMVVLLAWLVISVVLGGAGRWILSPTGETAMILAGLVMLVFGLLPVAGFLMMVVGFVRKIARIIRQWFARRNPPVQAKVVV